MEVYTIAKIFVTFAPEKIRWNYKRKEMFGAINVS
jgi:hypothetical protein